MKKKKLSIRQKISGLREIFGEDVIVLMLGKARGIKIRNAVGVSTFFEKDFGRDDGGDEPLSHTISKEKKKKLSVEKFIG